MGDEDREVSKASLKSACPSLQTTNRDVPFQIHDSSIRSENREAVVRIECQQSRGREQQGYYDEHQSESVSRV